MVLKSYIQTVNIRLLHKHTHTAAALFKEFGIALIIYNVNNQLGLCGTEQSCSNKSIRYYAYNVYMRC